MRRWAALAAAGAVAAVVVLAGSGDTVVGAEPSPAASACAAPPGLLAIAPALTHVAARIAEREGVTIVAIGSSSTQGVGASTPAHSYPSRLEADLRRLLPDITVRVLNRGKGGEEVAQMLTRIDRDVIAERPDLVIWQLGTNAVLHHEDVSGESPLVRRGLARLKATGSDIVLMDMQYAPRVIARPAATAMEEMIADLAARAHVGLFRRFEIMRRWQVAPAAAVPMVGPDGLHMTDRGYDCLAADLAEALVANWRGGGGKSPAATVAGLAGRHSGGAPAPLPAP